MDDKQQERARQLITQLSQGNYQEAVTYFNRQMREALTPGELQNAWHILENLHGTLQRQNSTRATYLAPYHVIIVSCTFTNRELELHIAFNAENEVSGFSFHQPQTVTRPADEQISYIQAESFIEKEIEVGTGEWSLPGILTLPTGEGPFPALVLVHGSGPQDRDETIGPNKPFQDLAWGLASQNIAVLRYDKRTLTHHDKIQLATLTVQEETIEDALAAVALLRTTAQINSQQIFVLGHSLGGYLLPRIGTLDSEIAGLIMLAGSYRALEDIIVDQITYIQSTRDVVVEEEQQYLRTLKEQAARVKNPQLPLDTPTSELPFGVPPAYWIDLRDYHPGEVAQDIKQPLLILQGESDYQVTMEDYQQWQHALANRSNVLFKSYPGFYHLFMPVAGGKMATPATYTIPGHVHTDVIQDITQWIKAHEV
ncbi:MAG TPA: alpha/beta fold hydrolase [Dictyobacter sp.]|jgi:dipeptidyl aminopeptidase/acylaminoacyl peptidase|nr:alpha/beta fold hydrolase [Dictyobacter sp.]